LKGTDHLEDVSVDGKIILKLILKNRVEGVNCIELALIGASGWLF
jgi:hypothetical protein